MKERIYEWKDEKLIIQIIRSVVQSFKTVFFDVLVQRTFPNLSKWKKRFHYFIHISNNSSTQLSILPNQFIDPFIYQLFTHLSIHPFTHSLIYPPNKACNQASFIFPACKAGQCSRLFAAANYFLTLRFVAS